MIVSQQTRLEFAVKPNMIINFVALTTLEMRGKVVASKALTNMVTIERKLLKIILALKKF